MRIAAIETYPVLIPLKPECRMVSALGRPEWLVEVDAIAVIPD